MTIEFERRKFSDSQYTIYAVTIDGKYEGEASLGRMRGAVHTIELWLKRFGASHFNENGMSEEKALSLAVNFILGHDNWISIPSR